MRGLDADHLRTFVAVCDSGSLSAAAPRVFLSPSSVSEQLAKLEQRLGATLLERGKSGAAPTAAGTRLLAHARAILALHETAIRDLTGERLEGELSLAISDYYRPSEIARVLQRLRAAYPALRLKVIVAKSAAIDALAVPEEFDVGLSMRIAPAAAGKRARQVALRRERLVWVAARDSAAGFERPLPLLALPDTCSLHAFTVRTLERRRVAFRLAHSASGVAGLQLAVAAGLGVACINESSMTGEMARCAPACGLPELPEVEFHLLPGRKGESPLVAGVREALLRLFA